MIDEGKRRRSAGEKAKEMTRQEGEPATYQSGHSCFSQNLGVFISTEKPFFAESFGKK